MEIGEIKTGMRVCGGEAGTEDYDEGTVLGDGHGKPVVDGEMVEVSWDSEVRTMAPVSTLSPLG